MIMNYIAKQHELQNKQKKEPTKEEMEFQQALLESDEETTMGYYLSEDED